MELLKNTAEKFAYILNFWEINMLNLFQFWIDKFSENNVEKSTYFEDHSLRPISSERVSTILPENHEMFNEMINYIWIQCHAHELMKHVSDMYGIHLYASDVSFLHKQEIKRRFYSWLKSYKRTILNEKKWKENHLSPSLVLRITHCSFRTWKSWFNHTVEIIITITSR